MRQLQQTKSEVLSQLIKLYSNYSDLFCKGNYKKALPIVDKYLEIANKYKYKHRLNKFYIINTYFYKIVCLLKIFMDSFCQGESNFADIPQIGELLRDAWFLDTSSEKSEFKKIAYQHAQKYINLKNKEGIFLYLMLSYPFWNASIYDEYRKRLDILLEEKKWLNLLTNIMLHAGVKDCFHSISFLGKLVLTYDIKTESQKILEIATFYEKMLQTLQNNDDFYVLSQDIEEILFGVLSTPYWLWQYQWRYVTYYANKRYEEAQKILEEVQKRLKEKQRNLKKRIGKKSKKQERILHNMGKKNNAQQGQLALLQYHVSEATQKFNKILSLHDLRYNRKNESLHNHHNTDIDIALAGKICIFLYQNEYKKAQEMATKYLFIIPNAKRKKKFLEFNLTDICSRFSEKMSDKKIQSQFWGAYKSFKSYCYSNIIDNDILLVSAQQGLWTSVLIHELKGNFQSILPLLGRGLNTNCLEKIQEILKELEYNYKKTFNLIQEFQERMSLHRVSYVHIPASYFDNIEKALHLNYLKSGIGVTIETKNELRKIPDFTFFSDLFYIEYILINLIRNSIESIREKKDNEGKIVVAIEYIEPEDKIKFTVEDNGIGFSSNIDLDFKKPFTSSKSGGIRGLGMYISRKFVESLDGNWEIDKNKNDGAKIYFSIAANIQKKDFPISLTINYNE